MKLHYCCAGLIAPAVTLALFVAPAQAKTHYEGTLVVIATAGTCADYDPIGERLLVRFQPAGVGGNPTSTGFTFMWGNGGYGATVAGPITSKYKTAVLTTLFDYGDSTGSTQIRFTSQKPATIATTTPWVEATGNITDFDGMPGCTVTFHLAALLRLN